MKQTPEEIRDDDFETRKERMLEGTKIKWYDIIIVVVCLSIVLGWVYFLLG